MASVEAANSDWCQENARGGCAVRGVQDARMCPWERRFEAENVYARRRRDAATGSH